MKLSELGTGQAGVELQRTWIHLYADKEFQKSFIASLFAKLSIQWGPIGAETLQERMKQANLASNELSQGIVNAREKSLRCALALGFRNDFQA
ncbi:MAG: hypothetical protein ACUVV0_14585 [Anaerolineae bacterium]